MRLSNHNQQVAAGEGARGGYGGRELRAQRQGAVLLVVHRRRRRRHDWPDSDTPRPLATDSPHGMARTAAAGGDARATVDNRPRRQRAARSPDALTTDLPSPLRLHVAAYRSRMEDKEAFRLLGGAAHT